MSNKIPKLIVHGGAWSIPDEFVDDHLRGVKNAVASTYPKLMEGMSAMDAVEYAVNILEADPTFDAGRGAFLNEKGEVELDAIIMDGRTLDFGAVGALQNILNPVSVARKVMEQTEHCFLVGTGALSFAKEMGFEELAPEALLTARELDFFNSIKNKEGFKSHHPFEFEPRDTVGAVAMDKAGNLAVATSTGGTARKLRGRVGDSPIVGAGAYADNDFGAVSATGWGESIMKVVLSKRVSDSFAILPAMDAAAAGIQFLTDRVKGLGGVIGINKNGDYALAYNTRRMARGFVINGKVIVEIEK
jgi:L-asparaginase / beta-aspartyl-peptidase